MASTVLARAELVLQAQEYSGTGNWLDASGNDHDATATGARFLGDDGYGAQYVFLPGVAGNFVSAPDAAALDVTADIDLRCRVALDDWTPSADQTLIAKWHTGTDQRSYLFAVDTTGALQAGWTTDGTLGTDIITNSTSIVGATNGDWLWVRMTLDVNNGASGYDLKFWTGGSQVAPPTTWTQLGSTVVGGSTTSVYSSSALLTVGAFENTGVNEPTLGKIQRAQVYNGIDGTLVFDADFSRHTVTEPFATFTEASSNGATVTFNRTGTAALVTTVVDVPMWVLNGSSDYLEVPDDNDLDFAASQAMTLMLTGRHYSLSTVPTTWISKKIHFHATYSGYQLLLLTSDRTLWRIADTGSARIDDQSPVGTAGVAHTYTGVRNISDTDTEAFLDAAGSESPTTDTTADLRNSHVFSLGRLSGGAAFLHGEIHAVALWREALSDADVATAQAELSYSSGSSVAFDDDVKFSVDVAFDSTPLAYPALWTDITADGRMFETRRGRSHELDQVAPSTMTLVLNNEAGKYDPVNTGSPYTGLVEPFKQIRMRATHLGLRYNLFTGFVTGWEQTWPSQKGAEATIRAVDGMKLLNRTFTSTAEVSERSDLRVGNLLDEASWPSAWRDLGTGAVTLQAHTPAAQPILSLLRTVDASEAGLLFIGGNGKVVFQARGYRAALVVGPTFGDAASGELGYVDLSADFDEQQIWNRVEVTRRDGTQQAAEDATSILNYGKRTLRVLDVLHNSDANALTFAETLRDRYKDAVYRIERLVFTPRGDADNLFPQALGLELSDLVTVKRRPPAGNTVSVAVHVEGVSHHVDARSKTWRTTLQLSPYE